MTEPTPELSVVVVTHRCRDLALHCLADLAAARRVVALEAHVVDNASRDGTVEAIRASHPWVDVEPLHENAGFGRANNRALRRCRAPAVLMLNPDTRIRPEALRCLLDALAAQPRAGIVGPRVVDEAGRLDPNCRRGFPTILGMAGALTGLDRILPWRALGAYRLAWLPTDEPADVVSLSGAAMLGRTDALRAVGGFDERFFMYGEDIDLCIRVAKAGWGVRYVPDATVVHFGGGSPGSWRSRRAWAGAIGEIHRIHHPGLRGRLSGAVCNVAGHALALVPARARRGRARRKRAPSEVHWPP